MANLNELTNKYNQNKTASHIENEINNIDNLNESSQQKIFEMLANNSDTKKSKDQNKSSNKMEKVNILNNPKHHPKNITTKNNLSLENIESMMMGFGNMNVKPVKEADKSKTMEIGVTNLQDIENMMVDQKNEGHGHKGDSKFRLKSQLIDVITQLDSQIKKWDNNISENKVLFNFL